MLILVATYPIGKVAVLLFENLVISHGLLNVFLIGLYIYIEKKVTSLCKTLLFYIFEEK